MSKDYIDALCYHKMYNSDACWKGSPRIVSQLKKLSSETAKYTAIKEKITCMQRDWVGSDVSLPGPKM